MEQIPMNKIVLITTKGCAGCSIMDKLIKQALEVTSKKITYETKDVLEIRKDTRNNLKLNDFPTVLFFKNNRLTRKEIGTRPVIVILRWIDIDFK